MAGRIIRRASYFILFCALLITSYNCGDPQIINKKYECDKSTDCKRSHECRSGKCVLSDDDKDGWGKNRDCNDNNKAVYPGAPEICDNSTDDNCDGRTDEQPCQCKDGDVRDCGSDKGICKKGQQTCRFGAWSKCTGSVAPQEEACDGKDNDCDGNIDEGVPNCCQPKDTRPCGSSVGQCKPGVQHCNTGKWTECVGAQGPKKEECNGLDDDCDGKVDNIKEQNAPIEQACYSGPPKTRKKGLCQDGKQFCKNGKWGLCQKDTLPQDEICDDKDNDCDGQIDNIKGQDQALVRECYSGDPKDVGKGICKKGSQRCVGGRWTGCQGEITSIAETCNGADDDCDGQIDNLKGSQSPLARACYNGPPNTRQKGLCKDGQQLCRNGKWDACKGGKLPEKEECDNKDNDCDGRTDNLSGKPDALTGTCYNGPAGTKGVGACKEGTRKCITGQWTSCSKETWPKKESCNGIDDNCDGKVDNGIPGSGSCNTGKSGICSTGTRQCTNGKLICQQIHQPQGEVCDGKDNNCNGLVDENNPGGGGRCTIIGGKGLCAPGVRACTGGKILCKQTIFPTTELCDGKDNNCNGTVDDNAKCPRGNSCSSGLCNPCPQPTSKCSEATLGGFSFCIKDAPSIQCNCGFTSYCAQQSQSVACSGCCVERKCK